MSKQMSSNSGFPSKKIFNYLTAEGFKSEPPFVFKKETTEYELKFYIAHGKAHVTVYINATDTTAANVFFPFQWVLANKLILVKWLVKEAVSFALHELREAPVATGSV